MQQGKIRKTRTSTARAPAKQRKRPKRSSAHGALIVPPKDKPSLCHEAVAGYMAFPPSLDGLG